MPYIKPLKRHALDIIAEQIALQCSFDGDLNYLLFAICKRYVKPSYNNYKNYLGELEEAIAEIRRRILAEYEEGKIAENGDVL